MRERERERERERKKKKKKRENQSLTSPKVKNELKIRRCLNTLLQDYLLRSQFNYFTATSTFITAKMGIATTNPHFSKKGLVHSQSSCLWMLFRHGDTYSMW
ncbi:hypothetical protein AAZX31_05G107100 [Glycine max]